MSVPITEVGQGQRYADKFLSLPNLTGTMLTLRVYAPGATGGILAAYLIDQDFTFGVGATIPLASISQHWVDVTLPVGIAYGSFDPYNSYQVSLEFQASAGPWTSPTVMYLDNVRSSNGLVKDEFTTSIDSMIASSSMMISGSTMTWVDRLP